MPPARICVVIPSAARDGVDYLADTLDDITAKLEAEADRVEAILVYNPSGPDQPHRGVESAQSELARGGYGVFGGNLRLLNADDLPPDLQCRHAATRGVWHVRHCNDYAHALWLARQTTADFVLLLEDDVRLTKHFVPRALEVAREAEKRSLDPLFLSLFSPLWGPPGAYFPFFAFSQALLFRNGPAVDAARAALTRDHSEDLADMALAKLQVNGRRGYVAYPSLVQHVGAVSIAASDRIYELKAPTFYEDSPPAAFGLRCRIGWIAEAIRRRIVPGDGRAAP